MSDPTVRERIVVVVPIRSFRNGKLRLSAVLDQEERAALLRGTAEGVVSAARVAAGVASVGVISADAEVLAWANRQDVVALDQPLELPGLNGAVSAGRTWALAENATAVLSLFADLPLLAPQDIGRLVERPEPVVLGPDRRGEGTNALLLTLDGNGENFRFAYGEGSLGRHMAEAQRLGLEARIVRSRGLAFDLDTPGDWTDYLAARPDGAIVGGAVQLPCGAGVG